MAEGIERPDGEGNLRVELLTGSLKGKARQVLLDDVRAGKVCRELYSFCMLLVRGAGTEPTNVPIRPVRDDSVADTEVL